MVICVFTECEKVLVKMYASVKHKIESIKKHYIDEHGFASDCILLREYVKELEVTDNLSTTETHVCDKCETSYFWNKKALITHKMVMHQNETPTQIGGSGLREETRETVLKTNKRRSKIIENNEIDKLYMFYSETSTLNDVHLYEFGFLRRTYNNISADDEVVHPIDFLEFAMEYLRAYILQNRLLSDANNDPHPVKITISMTTNSRKATGILTKGDDNSGMSEEIGVDFDHTTPQETLSLENINDSFNRLMQVLKNLMLNSEEHGSGWNLFSVKKMNVYIIKTYSSISTLAGLKTLVGGKNPFIDDEAMASELSIEDEENVDDVDSDDMFIDDVMEDEEMTETLSLAVKQQQEADREAIEHLKAFLDVNDRDKQIERSCYHTKRKRKKEQTEESQEKEELMEEFYPKLKRTKPLTYKDYIVDYSQEDAFDVKSSQAADNEEGSMTYKAYRINNKHLNNCLIHAMIGGAYHLHKKQNMKNKLE